MPGRPKARLAYRPLEHRFDTALGTRRHNEIVDATASHADQMVMMAHQVLGQFVTGPIVAADDLLHDASLFEHSEVAVHGTLRQLRTHLEQVGDGRRPADRGQQLDKLPSTGRVELVCAAKQRPSSLMNSSQIDR
ncbi:MAG: hypothetical protein QOE09_106 [Ilumatobacteraceae bacterium]